MSDFRFDSDLEWAAVVKQLKASPLTETRRLASAFDWVTRRIISHAGMEVEAARALGDEDAAVKQQIKMETIRHARKVFEECHLLTTGKKAWDDQDTV